MASSDNKLMLIKIEDPANSYIIGYIPVTFGLATVFINEGFGGSYHMYGTSGENLNTYEIDPVTCRITNSYTIPQFQGSSATYGATSSQFIGL